MVNYRAAFKLPFSNWKRTGLYFLISLFVSILSQIVSVLMGGNSPGEPVELSGSKILLIVLLYAPIILASFLTSGYSLRIAGAATKGQNILPEFQNILGMMGRGFQYVVASIIYSIPFLFILALSIVLMVAGGTSQSAMLVAIGAILMVPLAIIGLLFFLYLFPLLVVHFSHQERFGALFSVGKGIKYAFTVAYFVPCLVALAFGFLVVIIYVALLVPTSLASLANPWLGLFEAPVTALFAIFTGITLWNLFGQAYREAAGISTHSVSSVGKHRAAKK